jgi:hypothetical protein
MHKRFTHLSLMDLSKFVANGAMPLPEARRLINAIERPAVALQTFFCQSLVELAMRRGEARPLPEKLRVALDTGTRYPQLTLLDLGKYVLLGIISLEEAKKIMRTISRADLALWTFFLQWLGELGARNGNPLPEELQSGMRQWLNGEPQLPMPTDEIDYLYRMEADQGGSE